MTAPLIGITIHANDAQHRAALDRLCAQAIQGVANAGGLPVLIPPGLDEPALHGLFERLDGLLFTGGGDIAPAYYGGSASSLVAGVDVDRDSAELALMRWALDSAKPFFGICRGLQILNVACGGSLYQDIGECKHAERHTFYPDFPFDMLAHPIEIVPDSQLAHIAGKATLQVNSLHHQACQVVAPGLRVVARARDGMVEAIEVTAHPFGLAVQWHPEALPDAPEMRALFRALVVATRERSCVQT